MHILLEQFSATKQSQHFWNLLIVVFNDHNWHKYQKHIPNVGHITWRNLKVPIWASLRSIQYKAKGCIPLSSLTLVRSYLPSTNNGIYIFYRTISRLHVLTVCQKNVQSTKLQSQAAQILSALRILFFAVTVSFVLPWSHWGSHMGFWVFLVSYSKIPKSRAISQNMLCSSFGV